MPPKGQEFFYLDEDGTMQDADLHAAIIGPVDYPIDQKIMTPIRARNRAKWLAEQQAEQKAARLKSQWARTKSRSQALLQKFNPHHEPGGSPQGGQFSSGDGGGGGGEDHASDPTSASSLLKIEDVTLDDLYAKVPGSREQDAAARQKLSEDFPTDGQQSAGGYKLPNGHWAPDRLPVHRQIVDKLMSPEVVKAAAPAAGEKPTLYILGGRGGSGKGWFTGKNGTVDASKAAYINNDDVKESLPEYKGWNASLLHEEASHVGEVMEQYARDNKLNVIVDATLKSNTSLAKRIAQYKAAGYKISGHYMYASPATAAERALGRFVHGNEKNGKGRFVAPEYSLSSVSNEHTFDSHRNDMDYWEVYDNMGSSPKLHARSK